MGSRTPDLLNAIQTLYQLSYTPKKDEKIIAKFTGACQTSKKVGRANHADMWYT